MALNGKLNEKILHIQIAQVKKDSSVLFFSNDCSELWQDSNVCQDSYILENYNRVSHPILQHVLFDIWRLIVFSSPFGNYMYINITKS